MNNNNNTEAIMYYNEKTGNEYHGKNLEILEATGKTGGFCTFRQAVDLGYSVPKGTKAIAKIIAPIPTTDTLANGKIVEKMAGRRFSVFHISQLVKIEKVKI